VPYGPDRRLLWDEARDPSGHYDVNEPWDKDNRILAEKIWSENPRLVGMFTAPHELAADATLPLVVYPLGDRSIRRHEMTHAMNHATERGWLDGLPLSANVTGAARYYGVPGARALDELLAHRVGGDAWNPDRFHNYAQTYRRFGHHGDAAVMDALGIAQGTGELIARNPFKSGLAGGVAVLGGAAGGAMYMAEEEETNDLKDFQKQLDEELRRQAERRGDVRPPR